MFGIGLPELLVVAVVALLVLGPARLPELARSLGKGLAEFRRASADLRSTIMDATQDAREPLEEMQRELREATKVPPATPRPPASAPSQPAVSEETGGAPEGAAAVGAAGPSTEPKPDAHVDANVSEKPDGG
ncbi:MAG: twin-arginine translocase TatA/TatE family subunit [Myxococcota bacterium]|nr:twin-arginine translocase TatA/TatE family subunit [Myxococcota bacterium]